MKKLLVLCLSLFAAARALPIPSPVIEERHQLFILGVLSYLHNDLKSHPKIGHDISALIAWDVENLDVTPEFVIDRNRNFEKQGNIFHAEVMAIQRAAERKLTLDTGLRTQEESHQENSRKLMNATLYSSLEPCPFCIMGITWARIPKVIYFMEDPGMRDGETQRPIFSFPNEFFRRKLAQISPSSLPLALEVNQQLRDMQSQKLPGKYVSISPDGQASLDFGLFFKEQNEELLKSAYELFCAYEVQYEQNEELYSDLAKAVGMPFD